MQMIVSIHYIITSIHSFSVLAGTRSQFRAELLMGDIQINKTCTDAVQARNRLLKKPLVARSSRWLMCQDKEKSYRGHSLGTSYGACMQVVNHPFMQSHFFICNLSFFFFFFLSIIHPKVFHLIEQQKKDGLVG
jgi:hypothetical protein